MADELTRESEPELATSIEVRQTNAGMGVVLYADGRPLRIFLMEASQAHHLAGRLRKAANDMSAAKARVR